MCDVCGVTWGPRALIWKPDPLGHCVPISPSAIRYPLCPLCVRSLWEGIPSRTLALGGAYAPIAHSGSIWNALVALVGIATQNELDVAQMGADLHISVGQTRGRVGAVDAALLLVCSRSLQHKNVRRCPPSSCSDRLDDTLRFAYLRGGRRYIEPVRSVLPQAHGHPAQVRPHVE